MALKFVQTGGSSGSGSGTYDHNLLVNRGLPDQHTIESITGLRGALDKKYEKPYSGIPKTDLSFDVATLHDLDVIRKTDLVSIDDRIDAIADEVVEARGNRDRLKEYIDSKVAYSEWSGGGGNASSGSHLESQIGYPLYEQYKAYLGQTTFTLGKTYRMGTRQLEIYLNGMRMIQDDDYKEIDDHTIEFLFPLDKDDLVLFQVRAVINSGLHVEFTALLGQTIFTLPQPYGINQNILQVFRNGNLLRKGRDYKEINELTVEFNYPLEESDYITFHQAGATDPIAGTIMESEIGRVKINLGYTTMSLHDVAQTQQTDYRDMYIDTFITDKNIDPVLSYPYLYSDQAIQVDDVTKKFLSYMDFKKGTTVDTDVETYMHELRLASLPGGSELHSFTVPVDVADSVIETLLLMNRHHQEFYFYVEDKGTKRELTVKVKDKDGAVAAYSIRQTDGYFFGLSAKQDSLGDIHIVYHEQGSTSGKSKVYYASISGSIITHEVVSDDRYDAMSADIDIDADDTVHITFVSKRVNLYFNVEYRTIDAYQQKSGFHTITNGNQFNVLNPRIAVGADKKARIIYETPEIDGTHKNIKLVTLIDGVKETEFFVTTSTTFDNIQPDIAIDKVERCRITWRSTRLSSSYGIDYCSVGPDNIVTSVKTILAGDYQCHRPRIVCDYEDISHIVFNANYVLNDHENVCYTSVYPDNSVSSIENIASKVGSQYVDPTIDSYGEVLIVSALKDTKGTTIRKSLANYASTGRYTMEIDSRAKDTLWKQIDLSAICPVNTAVSIEYRTGNDPVTWSAWKPTTGPISDVDKGQYLQVRFTLASTDSISTPVIERFDVTYLPSYIEIQSVIKPSTKALDSIILLAQKEGDITFYVSRNGGQHFMEADLEKAIDLRTIPFGSEVVIKARIEADSKLSAWAALW